MKKHFHFIPRPLKVLLYFCGILCLSFLIYIFIGAPAFSVEHRYRRAERANLVGPAEILDIIELSPVLDETYDRMVIADVDDAVILYMCDTSNWKPDKLAYRQKQGKVTVFAAPYIPIIHHNDHEFEIPIILFDDFPQAVHAQIELELYSIQDTHAIPHTALPQKFFGEADRKKSGYFCFYIKSPDFSWFGPGKESEEPTLATLCKLTEKSFYRVDPNIILPVTVKLFDSKNQLVYEETVLIRDIVGDAHYRRAEQP